MNERELFLSALEINDPAARQAHLQTACGDDSELLGRVQSLLASHESQSQFLNTPVVEQLGETPEFAPTMPLPFASTGDEELKDVVSNSHGAGAMTNSDDPHKEIPLGYLQPSSRPDSLGRLAHYEVLEVIGTGAFGIVLKAFDDKLQRVVAIKVLAPEMAATSPARKRFLREARSSAAVRHDNVVSIYAVEDKPIPYLVMEYIPGQTLQQRLDEHGPLDLSDVLRLGKQIADGLAAAHAQQLIHRDIKPGNILLDTSINDHVKITDFGLARAADDASMTQSGMIAGTPLYMAPEQALGQKLDTRADLFSLGSVLYQMISGRPPFRAPTTVAVLKRVAEDTSRPIQEIIPETPDWMCHLVGHLHAKNPDDRYATAKEVSDLLAQCLADLEAGRKPQIAAPAPTAPTDESVHVTTAKPGRVGSDKGKKNWLNHQWGKAAAAVVLLFVGLGVTEATGVTQLTSTVIRIATGSGTLVIESNDPSVVISVDGEEITVRGGGIQELKLRPGKHRITATRNGVPIKQELVAITRNGRKMIQISLEPDGAGWVNADGTAYKSVPYAWPKDAPPMAIAPFDAKQAKQHQQAWANYLGVPVEKKIVLAKDIAGKEVNLTMVLIPPGEFLMGSAEKERTAAWSTKSDSLDSWFKRQGGNEYPQHRVRITRPFWLSRYEVTLGQFRRFVNVTTYQTDGERDGKGAWGLLNGKLARHPRFVWHDNFGFSRKVRPTDDFPVSRISWNDATKFCQWLSTQSARLTFTLPTEAQWEYACRAGTTTWWHFGDNEADLGNYRNEFGAVGRLKPNAFGLFDMHGNASEWCADITSRDYYSISLLDDPIGLPSGDRRVLRGGSEISPAAATRSAFRLLYTTDHRFRGSGFRVAAALQFTDADVRRIAALPAVKQYAAVVAELKRRNPGFDTSTARYEAKDGVIVELSFRSDHVTDISPVRALTGLKSLNCSGSWDPWFLTGKSGSPLADLSPLRGLTLTRLDCNGTKVADLSPLRGMPLEHLSLAATPVKDLSAIDGRPLTYLLLARTQVDDAGLAHFKDCKNLTVLNFRGTKVGDAGLANFENCKSLTELDLNETQVSDVGLAHFKACKHLTSLHLAKTQVGDAGLVHFKDCKHLTHLALRDTSVGDAGVAHFKNCKNLTMLFLPAKVTNAGLAHFKNCKDLQNLGIKNSKVTDLSLLKRMPLKVLWCSFRADRDAEILRSIKTLEKINGEPAAEFWKNVK